MDKVLVVKAIEPNYNTVSGGPPVMMVGGGRRRRGGDEPVGRTKREGLGGALGGTVGVLGALGGQHRSLGSLAQAMISGGAQGKALGGALGRKFVGRTGQRRADLREGRRQQRAQSNAEMAEDQRRRGVGVLSRINPAAKFRRDNQEIRDREDQLLDRTNLDHRTMAQAQQQVGVYGAEQVAAARNQAQRAANAEETARARRSGAEQGSRDRTDAETTRGLRNMYAASGINENDLDEAFNTMQSATAEQGQAVRYNTQNAEFVEDPTQGGNVAVRADGSPLGNVQDVVNQTLALPAPAGGANTEISDIESAGNTEAMNTGTDHQRRETVKVVNPKEDKEEGPVGPNELSRIQASLPRQEPGKRPAGQPVKVQQSSLGDFDEGFEQGGN